jgi:hypothetical protein
VPYIRQVVTFDEAALRAFGRADTALRRPATRESSDGVGLSIPRPTGCHPVGVRSTFVLDPARTEPKTGGPRAIPARVWYPAKARHGRSAPYFSAPVQAVIEREFGLPAGLFDIDTHATLDAPARRHARGVLLFTGGFLTHAGRALHRPDQRARLARVRGRGV